MKGKLSELDEKINDLLNANLYREFREKKIKISKEKFLKLKPFHWGFEFYEVFDLSKSKEERGFDVVIGNPPYISYYSRQAKPIEPYILSTYQNTYEFLLDKNKKSINTVMLFFEKGVHLLSDKRYLSYIIDVGFFEKVYLDIRNYLSDFNVYEIVTDISAFEKVASGQIIIGINSKKIDNFNCKIKKDFREIGLILNKKAFTEDIVNLSQNRKDIDYDFKNAIPLQELSDITCGLEYGALRNLFIADIRLNNKYHRVINGADGVPEKYSLIWNGKYILFDKEYEKRLIAEKKNRIIEG